MKLHILYYKISLYVCTSNDTRLGTFMIEKIIKMNYGFSLVLDHLGRGFCEL
jgi:hypothetical protein